MAVIPKTVHPKGIDHVAAKAAEAAEDTVAAATAAATEAAIEAGIGAEVAVAVARFSGVKCVGFALRI